MRAEGDRQTKITKESEKRPPKLHRMRCKCSDERPEVKHHAGLNAVASAVNSPTFAVDCAESAVNSSIFAVNCAESAVNSSTFAVNCAESAVNYSTFAVNCVESAVDFPEPAKNTRRPSARCALCCLVWGPGPGGCCWLVLHRHRTSAKRKHSENSTFFMIP